MGRSYSIRPSVTMQAGCRGTIPPLEPKHQDGMRRCLGPQQLRCQDSQQNETAREKCVVEFHIKPPFRSPALRAHLVTRKSTLEGINCGNQVCDAFTFCRCLGPQGRGKGIRCCWNSFIDALPSATIRVSHTCCPTSVQHRATEGSRFRAAARASHRRGASDCECPSTRLSRRRASSRPSKCQSRRGAGS